MGNYLVDLYQEKKSLLQYFVLTYLDKAISFALPLSILFVLHDNQVYNLVEVIFSYATLVMTVIELGFSNYLFWGYKQSEAKSKFIEDAKVFFQFILVVYCVVTVLVLTWAAYENNSELLLFLSLVCIRTLFTFYTAFYANIFRLVDRPSGIYAITILINLTSLLLLLVAFFGSWHNVIIYFFLPSALLIIVVVLRYLMVKIRFFEFSAFKDFLKMSMMFGWPIILNTLFMGFMNNYAKIYAYGNLSQQEMSQISYILRISMIIQLTHVSFSSFYSKRLYMDESRKFDVKIFGQYSLVLLLSVVLVGTIMVVTNTWFGSLIRVPFNLSTGLFVLHILLWCFIAYLEIYFGIMNANRRMLYYSMISSILYLVLLKSFESVNMLQLSILMVASTLLNLALVIMGLIQLKVIGSKSVS